MLADMRALLLVGYSSNMMAQIKLLGRILVEFASILSVIAMFLGFFAWFGESPPAKLAGAAYPHARILRFFPHPPMTDEVVARPTLTPSTTAKLTQL